MLYREFIQLPEFLEGVPVFEQLLDQEQTERMDMLLYDALIGQIWEHERRLEEMRFLKTLVLATSLKESEPSVDADAA